MSSTWKEFILKTLYGVAGFIVAALLSFLTQNPAIIGGSGALVIGVLSIVEKTFFPSTPTN